MLSVVTLAMGEGHPEINLKELKDMIRYPPFYDFLHVFGLTISVITQKSCSGLILLVI